MESHLSIHYQNQSDPVDTFPLRNNQLSYNSCRNPLWCDCHPILGPQKKRYKINEPNIIKQNQNENISKHESKKIVRR